MKPRKSRRYPVRLNKRDGAPRRVTTVDTLPDDVLRRAYAAPDELAGITADQLAKFQSQKEPQ